MATPLASDFTFFERSEIEARNGSILTSDNIVHVQNLLAMAAITLVNIESDPNNPMLAELQRAKLQGEIGAYRTLINTSRQAEQDVFEEAVMKAKIAEEKQKFQNAYEVFNSRSLQGTSEINPVKDK